jgi:RNA polymerase sigma-70 factor (ECF subfamily)
MDDLPPGGGRQFPTTRWTLILSSRESPEARRQALEQLLTTYWRPLYFFGRRKGCREDAAKDAVQGFFLHLLERDFLERLDPAKGRFRAYLKTSFDHYLVNLYEREAAQKRGGSFRFVPLDVVTAEADLAAAPEAPEAAFEREWALSIMERALTRLRREYEEGRRKGDVATILRFFRLDEAPSYAEAAEASSMTVVQFKASLHRARARFREILREEVADTVTDAEAHTEDELKDLLRILSA